MTDKTIVITHTDAAAQWATSTDRTPLFSVVKPNPDFDADKKASKANPREVAVEYTMPAKPNAGLALKYLKMARDTANGGADVAMSWLIEEAIGSEGYDSFADELAGVADPADAIALMRDVVGRIMKVAMGGLEAPKA